MTAFHHGVHGGHGEINVGPVLFRRVAVFAVVQARSSE
jgi:hypothetical protein